MSATEMNSNLSPHCARDDEAVIGTISDNMSESLTLSPGPIVDIPPPPKIEIPQELLAAGYVDLTADQDGGVLKLVTRPGYDTDRPVADDRVIVHYVAKLEDGGIQYDSTRERRKPFKFNVGKGDVIKGWDIAIPTMCRGEIATLRCTSNYAYAEAGSPPSIPPYATLIFEVEMLDFYGFDVSEDNDGLIYKSRLIQGAEFGSPNDASKCDIHIIGKYKGRVFDDRDVTFILGEGSEHGLVEGVEIGLKRFTTGETARLRIAAKLGYGNEGCAQYDIPPNADLDYEVQLKHFVKGKEFWDLDTQEKIDYSQVAKDKGGEYFKVGKYKVAKFQYSRVVEYLQFSDNLEGEAGVKRNQLVLAAHLNLALCNLKLANYAAAKESARKALEIDAKNEKAFFRRGMAHDGLKEYEQALADFRSVLEIDADNKAARHQIVIINNKIKEQCQNERRAYAGMFDKLAKMDVHKQTSTSITGETFGQGDKVVSEKVVLDSTSADVPTANGTDSKTEPNLA